MQHLAPLSLGLILCLTACGRTPQTAEGVATSADPQKAAAAVDGARLLAANEDTANWITYGRTYDEQRFSPLKQITPENVPQLKLAWYFDLPTAARAQESTPLVIDDVMYVTSAWSKVFALNAGTGELLWSYDPKVPGEWAVNACCDVVNRGVAAWNGKLYLGTLDGRLVALDAATGKPVWEVLTIDRNKRYTITGAPRVVKGKVLIGNGGSEMGVRGYLSAYDAESGEMVWRFYTVPGEPGKPDGAASDAVHASKTVSTWTGEWWKLGGGGTVWDSMAYDPELDLLYVGVGNGSPWNQAIRSPNGGDNLFLASIVALKPDTGEYVWHYQTTPGESWDFTATQHMILADLTIDGRERQVIMQAPKNGFFYVLDRATGELLSAEPFAKVNWAKGIDRKTGRPIENPQARFGKTGKVWISMPGPLGAHNWTPMSYSPLTRLVYIPVTEMGFPYVPPRSFETRRLAWNVGIDLDAGGLPQDRAVKAAAKENMTGHLAAWDPVTQREVWRAEYEHPWNGGVLSTAGNLVFQGTAVGELNAYQADSGKRLWSHETQAGVLAPPITYQTGSEQYIAVEVGWGGAFGLAAGELARDAHLNRGNMPRVLAFKLNGAAALPALPERAERPLQPPSDKSMDAQTVAQGKALFHLYCGTCHGDSAVSGGVLPDLRYSAALSNADLWKSIVLQGSLKERGMASFAAELDPGQTELIRSYVIRRANESIAEAPSPKD